MDKEMEKRAYESYWHDVDIITRNEFTTLSLKQSDLDELFKKRIKDLFEVIKASGAYGRPASNLGKIPSILLEMKNVTSLQFNDNEFSEMKSMPGKAVNVRNVFVTKSNGYIVVNNSHKFIAEGSYDKDENGNMVYSRKGMGTEFTGVVFEMDKEERLTGRFFKFMQFNLANFNDGMYFGGYTDKKYFLAKIVSVLDKDNNKRVIGVMDYEEWEQCKTNEPLLPIIMSITEIGGMTPYEMLDKVSPEKLEELINKEVSRVLD